MSQSSRPQQLPPRLPPDVEDINRAICLLGNRIASELKDKTKGELISLLGIYPSQEQAKYWKQALKRLLKEGLEPDALMEEPEAFSRPSSGKRSSRKKNARKKSSTRRSFDEKPKRFSQQPPNKLQQLYKRQLASDESLYPGVSNLSGIDLELLRDEDDWRADFDF